MVENILRKKWDKVSFQKRKELISHTGLPDTFAKKEAFPNWNSLPEIVKKELIREEKHWKIFTKLKEVM